jgi:hypothetical protein
MTEDMRRMTAMHPMAALHPSVHPHIILGMVSPFDKSC